jgi:NADPH-dependent ferric siderophore reductase
VPYRLHRELYPSAVRHVRLVSRRILAPGFVRVRLQAQEPGGLRGFRVPGAGDHVRVLVAATPDGVLPETEGHDLPAGEPRVETVVDHDVNAGWIDLDVLVHGDVGRIGPWAARAPLGSPAIVADPKGSVLMTGLPAQWLLAGDDSAVPAIRRYLRMLGASSRGTVLLETRHEPASLELDVPEGVEVSILTPQRGRPSAALADAITALDIPVEEAREGEFFVFACGEQSLVAPVRAQLTRWHIDADQAVVKGYWRRN